MVNKDNLKSNVFSDLINVYTAENRELLNTVKEKLEPYFSKISDVFYDRMLELDEARYFLDNKIVSERLHKSMTNWIKTLFLPYDEKTIEEYLKWQLNVGLIHSRINVPMRLVNYGLRIIKNEFLNAIERSDIEEKLKFKAYLLINQILDYSVSLINDSYLENRIDNENNTQKLKFHIMNMTFIVEIERLRASIFDWLRRIISNIYSDLPNSKPSLSSAYSSEFGLWLTYKAELIFSDRPDLMDKLKEKLNEIQAKIDEINSIDSKNLTQDIGKHLEVLSDTVSQMAWLLMDLSNEALELESARDPLTKLFNRRFLPSVMQKVVKTSKEFTLPFTVMYCDIDDFKNINDTYGHEMGDVILAGFSDLLYSCIRSTDYIFRMGGDEFLVILVGANKNVATKVSNKILTQVSTQTYKLNNKEIKNLRISIGIAEYKGHPDYNVVIDKADQALYKAKKSGKNKFFIEE